MNFWNIFVKQHILTNAEAIPKNKFQNCSKCWQQHDKRSLLKWYWRTKLIVKYLGAGGFYLKCGIMTLESHDPMS